MSTPTRFRFWTAYSVTWLVILSYSKFSLWRFLSSKPADPEKISALHSRNALRIEKAIIRLQGLFIKVGQLISIMTNFLPEEFRQPLVRLQDQVPARSLGVIQNTIEQELGAAPEVLFDRFDATPIASASLGQVHRAKLKSGEEVVVKVQHPEIDTIAHVDLKIVWRILRLVRWFVPVKGLETMYAQIRAMTMEELDFQREAAQMQEIGLNLSSQQGVTVPRFFAEYSTRKVLTISFVRGCKLTDLVAVQQRGQDPSEVARRLIRAYCRMIFVDGMYHADPHPGNLLLSDAGEVSLLDFGAVGRLSPRMRQAMPRFVEAVIRRDTQKIIAALREMGFIARGRDTEQAAQRIVEYFYRRFQEEVQLDSFNLKDIRVDPQKSLERILDLRREDIGIRELMSTFQVPKDWVLLERTLILLVGVCTTLDDKINPTEIVWPYLEEFVVGKDRDLGALLLDTVRDTALSALSLPEELRKYLSKANQGQLEVRVAELGSSAQLMYALGHQVIYTLGAIASAAFVFVGWKFQLSTFASVSAAFLGFFVLLLLGSMFRAKRWTR